MANFRSGQVSVTTSATPVFTVGSFSETALVSASADVYIGGEGVTSATGFLVPANATVVVPTSAADNPPLTLYAAAKTGTATVSYLFPA